MIRSPAEISTIMPNVESSTRIEYSKMRPDGSARYSAESTSVAADPISARIFRKRAKSSTTKPPANVVSLPVASTSSGNTGSKGYPALSKLMARRPEQLRSLQQPRCLHGSDCGGVVIDQLLHRRRRHVQHRLRIDPEQDGESHQRHQCQAFAQGKILDARQ